MIGGISSFKQHFNQTIITGVGVKMAASFKIYQVFVRLLIAYRMLSKGD